MKAINPATPARKQSHWRRKLPASTAHRATGSRVRWTWFINWSRTSQSTGSRRTDDTRIIGTRNNNLNGEQPPSAALHESQSEDSIKENNNWCICARRVPGHNFSRAAEVITFWL